jgi:adenosylcobinamide amidohydrolase
MKAGCATASRDSEVSQSGRWLVVRFAQAHAVASWAVVGGGVREADAVAWRQVTDGELRPPVEPARWLRRRMEEEGVRAAVGLLTSRRLDAWVEARADAGGVRAHCVATVGLGNALRAGDPPGPAGRIGTINLVCRVDVPLATEALLEGLAIATEAKTAAILEAGVVSRVTGRAATGTGTDCVVVAAPARRRGAPYAGKHTAAGSALGAAVLAAVTDGARAWLREPRGVGP